MYDKEEEIFNTYFDEVTKIHPKDIIYLDVPPQISMERYKKRIQKTGELDVYNLNYFTLLYNRFIKYVNEAIEDNQNVIYFDWSKNYNVNQFQELTQYVLRELWNNFVEKTDVGF